MVLGICGHIHQIGIVFVALNKGNPFAIRRDSRITHIYSLCYLGEFKIIVQYIEVAIECKINFSCKLGLRSRINLDLLTVLIRSSVLE